MAQIKPTGKLLVNEPIAKYTSWRVGGKVDRLYIPDDVSNLCSFLSTLDREEKVYFIGLGSNILVRDGGVRGTVILVHNALDTIRLESGLIYAEAGVTCAKLAKFSAKCAKQGAEFMAGIPGTVGGALAMNAGCYGGETWGIVEKVLTVDKDGNIHERKNSEYVASYRHIDMPSPDEWFIAAWFRLDDGNSLESEKKIKELLAKRLHSQPLNLPNAGSTFRNPEGDHAARLIEACGLKGYKIGGAQVSEKHANFIVNLGDATANDIEEIIGVMKAEVKTKFGVDLLQEVRVIGDKNE